MIVRRGTTGSEAFRAIDENEILLGDAGFDTMKTRAVFGAAITFLDTDTAALRPALTADGHDT